jgi:hypothetical protein
MCNASLNLHRNRLKINDLWNSPMTGADPGEGEPILDFVHIGGVGIVAGLPDAHRRVIQGIRP